MIEHEAGQGAKYTRGRRPFRLVYKEVCKGRGFALKRELEIKSLNRDQKLKLVSGTCAARSEPDAFPRDKIEIPQTRQC